MTHAMPPTPVGILDDARNRAADQRIDLAVLATRLAQILEAREALFPDIGRASADLGMEHLDWADLAERCQLQDIDRATDTLAAIHTLVERALGI